MLRATFATYLADKTHSTKTIMNALGVTDESTALHYIRESEKFRGRNFIRDNSIVSTILNSLGQENGGIEPGEGNQSMVSVINSQIQQQLSTNQQCESPAFNNMDTYLAQMTNLVASNVVPMIVTQVMQQMAGFMMMQQQAGLQPMLNPMMPSMAGLPSTQNQMFNNVQQNVESQFNKFPVTQQNSLRGNSNLSNSQPQKNNQRRSNLGSRK